MQLKEKKLFLEGYGLIKMTLGVFQLVGLFFGYFLYEWIIKYNQSVMPVIFEPDIIILTYLAVIIRSFFHIVAGVGIARMENWSRYWLIFGWPFILCINGGLSFSLYQQWQAEGQMNTSFFNMIVWPKLIIFIMIVFFDWIFVNKAIREINDEKQFLKDEGRIDSKYIRVVFFSMVILLGALLFFGRPLKKGFYKGYYKVSGQKSKEGTQVTTLESKKEGQRSLRSLDIKKGETSAEEIFQPYQEKKMFFNEDPEKAGIIRRVKGIKKEASSQGVSTRNMIGFSFGVCLILGFVFQIFQAQFLKASKNKHLYSYLFFLMSVILLTVYGLSLNLAPLWLAGFMGIVANIVMILLLLNRD